MGLESHQFCRQKSVEISYKFLAPAADPPYDGLGFVGGEATTPRRTTVEPDMPVGAASARCGKSLLRPLSGLVRRMPSGTMHRLKE